MENYKVKGVVWQNGPGYGSFTTYEASKGVYAEAEQAAAHAQMRQSEANLAAAIQPTIPQPAPPKIEPVQVQEPEPIYPPPTDAPYPPRRSERRKTNNS